MSDLNNYDERVARVSLAKIPHGVYQFHDFLDDDGAGQENIKIALTVSVEEQQFSLDFTGTAAQVKGNLNCPLSVAAAAVYYVFRCLIAQTGHKLSIKTPGGDGWGT